MLVKAIRAAKRKYYNDEFDHSCFTNGKDIWVLENDKYELKTSVSTVCQITAEVEKSLYTGNPDHLNMKIQSY